MKVLLIHLSDLHFKEDSKLKNFYPSAIRKASLAELWEEQVTIFITVTGDIAYSGAKAEYDKAVKFFREIKKELKKDNRIQQVKYVFVPGNHDCNFREKSTIRDAIIDGEIDRLEFDDQMIQEVLSPQENFYSALSKLNPSCLKKKLFYKHIVTLKNDKKYSLAFECYNTAWCSRKEEEKGDLIFPPEIIDNSDKEKDKVDVTISLMHHTPSWLSNELKFTKTIENRSHFIFTGHDHDPKFFSKEAQKPVKENRSTTNQYLKGGVIKAHGLDISPSFHSVIIDFKESKANTFTFQWNKGRGEFQSKCESSPIDLLSLGQVSNFQIDNKFRKDELHNIGATLEHPREEELKLDDVFVFPELKEADTSNSPQRYRSLQEFSSKILKEGWVRISGDEKMGKTALAKKLFLQFKNLGFVPILLSGERLGPKATEKERLNEIIREEFGSQYDGGQFNRFQQLNSKKKVFLIDDLDHSNLNKGSMLQVISLLKSRSSTIVTFQSTNEKFGEIGSGERIEERLRDDLQYEIQKFDCRKQDELVEKWIKLGRRETISNQKLNELTPKLREKVDNTLGYNLLPSNPFFLLAILQSIENSEVEKIDCSRGHIYDTLIRERLLHGEISTDTKRGYLQFMALEFFEKNQKKVDEKTFDYLHEKYRENIKKVSKENIVSELKKLDILQSTEGSYSFKYDYLYFYFVAAAIENQLDRRKTLESIDQIICNIEEPGYQNILINYYFNTQDNYLFDKLLEEVNEIFQDVEYRSIDEATRFVNEIISPTTTIHVNDEDRKTARREKLKLEDQLRKSLENNGEATRKPTNRDKSAKVEEEGGKEQNTRQLGNKLRKAHKLTKLMGELVRAFQGRMEKELKVEIITQTYKLGKRTLLKSFSRFEDNGEEIIEHGSKIIKEKLEEEEDEEIPEEDIRGIVRTLLLGFLDFIALTGIKTLVKTLGSRRLKEIYQKIERPNRSELLFQIEYFEIRAIHLQFPENSFDELVKRLEGHDFLFHILSLLGAEYLQFYWNRKNHRQKQKIENKLLVTVSDKGKKIENKQDITLSKKQVYGNKGRKIKSPDQD